MPAVIRDIRERYGRKPSAIDTIDDRKQYDIMDHDSALLRLGTGYIPSCSPENPAACGVMFQTLEARINFACYLQSAYLLRYMHRWYLTEVRLCCSCACCACMAVSVKARVTHELRSGPSKDTQQSHHMHHTP